jgi:hypothetical protein
MSEKGIATPSSFAGIIKVNPATITHILNSRNNISLEVVKKILHTFPDINSDWLLSGTEPMFKNEKTFLTSTPSSKVGDLFENQVVESTVRPDISEYSLKNEVEKPKNTPLFIEKQEIKSEKIIAKKIDKIMIFYSDNTFTSFSPEQ